MFAGIGSCQNGTEQTSRQPEKVTGTFSWLFRFILIFDDSFLYLRTCLCVSLQGISLRTTEMEDTAKSFSSTAKELLNAVEYNKQSSKS